MKYSYFTILLFIVLLLPTPCKPEIILNVDKGIVRFGFDNESSIGAGYTFTIKPDVSTNTFIIENKDSLPQNVNLTALKAKFSTINTLVKVKVNGIQQVSRVTVNDFSKMVIYDSYAEDGEVFHYKVVLKILKKVQSSRFIVISTDEVSDEVFSTISTRLKNNENANIKVAVSAMINYLSAAPTVVMERLTNLLSLADKYNLPVMVELDGIDWQQGYPELWNWWDPTKQGYNPTNKNNVEWTSWDSESAVKLGWRNWGSQIRVMPMPNLASPAYREACFTQLKVLIPFVLNWWKNTGYNDRFVGIQMENEVSIGSNNYFLPNGNSYIDKPATDDHILTLNHDIWPGFGAKAIGYAAVKTMGLASCGALNEADVAKVTDKYVYDLCKLGSEIGVPRNKLFTHAGGWKEGELIYYSALNEYSCPGWSFYDFALDPSKDKTAMDAVTKSDAPFWCNAESFYFGGSTEETWLEYLNNNFSIPRLKYMVIRNYRAMKDKDYVFSAINNFKQLTKNIINNNENLELRKEY